jgi:predicted 2-oxoglutarate/Fe(II)-dependent dioxygenase YbiX
MSGGVHDRNSAEADAFAASVFGQSLPEFVGATLAGRFFSKDAQAGRPAIFVALGAGEPESLSRLLAELDTASAAAAAANVDLVPLAPMDPAILQALSAGALGRERVVIVSQSDGMERAALAGHPAAIAVDRAGRIVDAFPFRTSHDVAACLQRIAGLVGGDGAGIASRPIPVLVAPNLVAPDCCAALIDLFERSEHVAGRMAAVVDGKPANKLDASRKSRRDLELTAAEPLHGRVMEVLAGRCAPAVKFAFQREVAFVDRILIARYDIGDHFLRHRDNLAPQTAFREFAVTINLNTDDYDGGCLRFPEFSDQVVAPPAGSAAIFSASLLHEVTPVTRGVRYCVLTFLSSQPPGPPT